MSYLDSWDKYKSFRSSGSLNFQPDHSLTQDVLKQAGPASIYFRDNHKHEISNVSKITREPSKTIINQVNQSAENVQYKINQDQDPMRIVRPITPVTHKQSVRVRYLEPPNPKQHAPIIIKERQVTPPPIAPPIVIRQRAKTPPPLPPLIIREKPPAHPEIALEPTFIEKLIPPPTPPPRQVIVERIPAPQKPREIIYEKWLPYKKPEERQIIVQKAKPHEKPPAPKNLIIDYHHSNINIDKQIMHEGTIKADPQTYHSSKTYLNGELRLVDKIDDDLLANLQLPNSNFGKKNDNNQNTINYSTYIPTVSDSKADELAKKFFSSGTKSTKSVGALDGSNLNSTQWNTTYKTSYTGRGLDQWKKIK